jgi:hypothetical protein
LERKYWNEFVKKGSEVEEFQSLIHGNREIKDPAYFKNKDVMFSIKEKVDPRLILLNSLVLSVLISPMVPFLLHNGEFSEVNDIQNKIAIYVGFILGFLLIPSILIFSAYFMRKDYTVLEGGILVIRGKKMRANSGKFYVSRSFFLFDIKNIEKVKLFSLLGGMRKPFALSGDLSAYTTMKQYLITLSMDHVKLPPFTGKDELTKEMRKERMDTLYDNYSEHATIPRYILEEINDRMELGLDLP